MNIFKIIEELHEEKKRIDKAIAALEELITGQGAGPDESAGIATAAPPGKKRRGRPRKYPATTS